MPGELCEGRLADPARQVADGAGEAIQPEHDQGLAAADVAQTPASTGRLGSAPEACSLKTLVHPAARSSSSCGLSALLLGGDPA
ncbi:MAG: hypothetical protein JO110_03000 [Acetobacteraceae bacterium]|nr:hypothetical protein [Acetobacteraceae bacterium]